MTTDDDDMENRSGAYFVLRDALGDEQRASAGPLSKDW